VTYYRGGGNDVEVTVIDADANVRSARRISVGGSTSLHECAITERFVVPLDLPVTFSMESAQAGAMFPYRWQEDSLCGVGAAGPEWPIH
jgi:carotenoid cleavage dioxygenase